MRTCDGGRAGLLERPDVLADVALQREDADAGRRAGSARHQPPAWRSRSPAPRLSAAMPTMASPSPRLTLAMRSASR